MITNAKLFDKLVIEKFNGTLYHDDYKTNIKYKFYSSRYLLNQIFNYIFSDKFEQLAPEHDVVDNEIAHTRLNTEFQRIDTRKKIILKIQSIYEVIQCILKDCDPLYYGEEYKPNIIFKHEKRLTYTNLEYQNIYKHHVILRIQDENRRSNHPERTGDWLVYSRTENIIKFIMLCQHPDNLINSVSKMSPIISENSIKVDRYCSDMDTYQESNENFLWTPNDYLYFIQKLAPRSRNLPSKQYHKVRGVSIKMHEDLICLWVNSLLGRDPVLIQNN